MKKTSLTAVLALLVIIQAMVAVADVHRYELGLCDGSIHAEQAYEKLCDSPLPELPPSEHNAQDCEHCCHCHGSAVAALAYQMPLFSHAFELAPAPALALMPRRLLERSIRPPIV